MLRYIKSFFGVEEAKEKFEASEDPVAQTLTEEQSVMPGNYKLQQYPRNLDQRGNVEGTSGRNEFSAPFDRVLSSHETFFKDYRNFLEGTRKERSNDEASPTFRELTMNGSGNGTGGAATRMIAQDTRNYQRDNCVARKY